METTRLLALKRTDRAREQVATLRLKLLKAGKVILRYNCRVRFRLGSAYPQSGDRPLRGGEARRREILGERCPRYADERWGLRICARGLVAHWQ